MLPGFLAGESVRPMTPANLIWIDQKSGTSYPLTEAGVFGWSKSPRLPAFQCEECGTIEMPPPPDEPSDGDPEDKG
jgi:hypothetical protein